MRNIPIEQQIACVRREIAMRKRVYPRWVDSGRMTAENAQLEIDAMAAVLVTLTMANSCRWAGKGFYDTEDSDG